jgi:predicted ferric reductase
LRDTNVVNGQFTGRIEAELRPGREVRVKLPYREFIINIENDGCLLADGIGVTAFTDFLDRLSE